MAVTACLVLVGALVVGSGTTPPRGHAEAERRLWPETFAAQRPQPAEQAPGRPAKVAQETPVPTHQQFVGVTLWRVTPAPAGTPAADFTAQRLDPHREVAPDDRVRLSLESTRRGYLYVIDREEYADGSTSEPVLLFPTSRLRGGNNRVAPGRVVELPDQLDLPPFFSLRRSRDDHVGERLTVIVSDEPLPDVRPGEGPQQLERGRVAEWERRAAAAQERIEPSPGAQPSYSQAERDAGGPQARLLVHTDPLPQTLYRIDASQRPGSVALVHVRIPIGR